MNAARRKPPLKKRILSSWPVHVLGSLIVSLAMRLVYITAYNVRQWPSSINPYKSGEKPALFCFWHGRLLMQPFLKPPRPHVVLVSKHNDGGLITAVMRWFGVGAVRGSKSRRGASDAVRTLLDTAAKGINISITPDGPRGPFQVAAPGAIYVAMKTGYPIIPVTFSARRHWRLRSWDRFMIPKFFTRIVYIAGDPITVPPDASDEQLEQATQLLNTRLNELTLKADQICGVAA